MYGLILSNMSEYIISNFGPGKWKEVREKLDIKEDTFLVTESYPEGQAIKMG